MSFLKTLPAIIRDFIQYFSPKTARGRYRLIVLVLLAALLGYVVTRGNGETQEAELAPRTVVVGTIASLDTARAISLVGTVEAIDQASLLTEAAGRVTAVSVSLGDSVRAGQTIATLEGASQYAALLQAEGAYEAAVAAAASSDVSAAQAASQLTAAQNTAAGALRGAYTNVSNGFYTLIDGLYGNPNTTLPGVRVASPQTAYLNTERVAFQDILPAWQQSVAGLGTPQDIDAAITTARSNTTRAIAVIDAFIGALNGRETDTLQGKLVATWISELNALRSNLNGSLAALDAAAAGLSAARDTLAQAELSGTGGDVSLADAQVKQALGALRAAQASYAKTIIRTPIAGVINTLEVKAGDYVGQGVPAATIANNQALEITTFVGEQDLNTIATGDEVLIEGVHQGRITAIAPAVNPATQKVEVKIQTESTEIANGDTVRIALTGASAPETTAATSSQPIPTALYVPLTSVKFTATDGVMFTVADGVLVSHPVTLGRVSGDTIEIVAGIDTTTVFVIDARGLSDGQRVEAVMKQ
jgi:multidrug efflux pump subunit AcrA (membrane-fusion protein)